MNCLPCPVCGHPVIAAWVPTHNRPAIYIAECWNECPGTPIVRGATRDDAAIHWNEHIRSGLRTSGTGKGE